MKFCINCSHFWKPSPSTPDNLAQCDRKENPRSPVDGDYEPVGHPHPFCRAERVSLPGNCGAEAIFFEEKSK